MLKINGLNIFPTSVYVCHVCCPASKSFSLSDGDFLHP